MKTAFRCPMAYCKVFRFIRSKERKKERERDEERKRERKREERKEDQSNNRPWRWLKWPPALVAFVLQKERDRNIPTDSDSRAENRDIKG